MRKKCPNVQEKLLKFEAEKASNPYHLSILVKVRQSQKQLMISSILQKKLKLSILSKERAQDSEFRSVFLGELRKQ